MEQTRFVEKEAALLVDRGRFQLLRTSAHLAGLNVEPETSPLFTEYALLRMEKLKPAGESEFDNPPRIAGNRGTDRTRTALPERGRE